MLVVRALIIGLILTALIGAACGLSGQSQLVWEAEYGDGATATPVTIDGTTVSISGLDPFGVGSPGNFTVNYATRGTHAGYWESGLDATNRSQDLTFRIGFSRPVETLTFSMLDIDTNLQFHDSITVVGWNGNAPFAPTTTFLGVAVAQVGPGVYSGRASVGNLSADANVGLRFDQPLDSVTFRYGPGPNSLANPSLQVMGLSDMTWSVPCAPTAFVSTMAQLRAAVADACVTLILISPGNYDLTSSGSGQLDIDQDKILRNVGGGEVVIDARGASRAIRVQRDNTVELDGLTITGGDANDGGGVWTRGDLTVRNSTITGNTTSGDGGGLFQRGGSLIMENVTVSGNVANNDGGGLYLRDPASLVHVTVANNSADRGGGIRSRDNEVTLANTVVADNASNSGGQIRGDITSLGVNLVEGGCGGCQVTDLTLDPNLLPLASNGGNSRTHALGLGSIAIDAGSAAFGLPTDQRGVGRPIGPGFDLGAYEAPSAISVSVTAAAPAVDRLPSNGTPYSEAFTVTNTGAAPSSYTLTASSTGSAVTVDSIRGPGLTWGARADSARTGVLLGSGGAVTVDVFYTVLDVAAGTDDTLTLTATSSVLATVTDSDATTVSVVRPFLGLTKIATVAGDTVPGAAITYQMTVTNLGTREAVGVVVADTLPAELEYLVGSTAETLPSGIGVTLEFDDGTGTWSYAPIAGGCGAAGGYDRCVSAVRWTLDAPLPGIGPANTADFSFGAAIR